MMIALGAPAHLSAAEWADSAVQSLRSATFEAPLLSTICFARPRHDSLPCKQKAVTLGCMTDPVLQRVRAVHAEVLSVDIDDLDTQKRLTERFNGQFKMLSTGC